LPQKPTLVLGIGNTLLSDEGVGIHMLDYLREQYPDLPHVDYLDGGTLSFTLAPYIEATDKLIVVDAAELQAPPGTVKILAGQQMDHFAGKTKRSVHEVSLGDLLAIAHLTDALPENRALIAIQPAVVDWGHDLTAPVEQALPVAAEYIIGLMREWAPEGAFSDPGMHVLQGTEPTGAHG
jgi:hydrogenase maturation protease